MKKHLKLIAMICLVCIILPTLALATSAAETLPLPSDNQTENTLFMAGLMVLVALFMLAIVFLVIVLMKTKKNK